MGGPAELFCFYLLRDCWRGDILGAQLRKDREMTNQPRREMPMTDLEKIDLCNALDLLDKAATLIYNMEGDRYQSAYEKLESVLDSLGGAK